MEYHIHFVLSFLIVRMMAFRRRSLLLVVEEHLFLLVAQRHVSSHRDKRFLLLKPARLGPHPPQKLRRRTGKNKIGLFLTCAGMCSFPFDRRKSRAYTAPTVVSAQDLDGPRP